MYALPDGIRSRQIPGVNGLDIHLLEAGPDTADAPCLLLLHGFPELAYSWRAVMPALAAAGYRVIAPDQRGYGRTTGWSDRYDCDLMEFRLPNLVRDMVGLLAALDIPRTRAVIGHDFGSPVAAWCALIRPDLFPAAALMSAPFAGPPGLPRGIAPDAAGDGVHAAMARLARPRKHYQWYYSTRAANADMTRCPEGLQAFLRAYYHVKSADWPDNRPFRLAGWEAEELAKMPTYYIMDLAATMPESVAPHMPSPEAVAACRWLPEADMAVYAGEYARTGFQGGLNWYRCGTDPRFAVELQLHAGRRLEVPTMFVAGASDWGIQQRPGALERMQDSACADFRGCHLIEGAGHWVQQEQPEAVSAALLDFLGDL